MNAHDRRGLVTEPDPELEAAEARAPGRRMRTDQLQQPVAAAQAAPGKDAPRAEPVAAEPVAHEAKASTIWDAAPAAPAKAEPETAAATTAAATTEAASTEAATEATEVTEAATSAEPDAGHEAAATAEPESSPAELAEAETWLADARAAFAMARPEVHTCDSGCAHAQLSRIMAGYAEAHVPHVDQSHVNEALRKHRLKHKKPAGDDKKAAEPAGDAPQASPAPDAAGPDAAGPMAPDAGHSAAYSGTVTDSKPAGFPTIMGLTTWDFASFTYPDLKLTTTQQADKSWETAVQTTTSAEATTPAIAVPVGVYPVSQLLPVKITDEHGKLIKTEYWKQKIDVDAAANSQVKVAEKEHVDDISEAYKITLKAAEVAVNAQVSTKFADKDKAKSIKQAKDAVKAALDPKLTADPATWKAMLQTCANLTKTKRDTSNWHTFIYQPNSDADYDADTKTAISHVQNNPNVGVTGSSTIIKL